MKIRKAVLEDAKNIYEIIKECAIDMKEKDNLEHWFPIYSIENIERDIKEKDVFILEIDNDKITATFSLSSNKSYLWKDESNSIYLSKLAVRPTEEGKGIGKTCMQFIEEYAKEKKYKSIRFDVYEKSRAVDFYKKLDYKVISTAHTTRFQVLLMEKEI